MEPFIDSYVKFNSNTGWVTPDGGAWNDVFQVSSTTSTVVVLLVEREIIGGLFYSLVAAAVVVVVL